MGILHSTSMTSSTIVAPTMDMVVKHELYVTACRVSVPGSQKL
jgi:hypothetical protein